MELLTIISLGFMFLGNLIVSVNCTNGSYPVNGNKLKSSRYWNDEDKTKLLKIFYETNTGEINHAKRIKDRWDGLYQGNRISSSHNLYIRLIDWIASGEADRLLTEEERLNRKYEPRPKKMYWTPEMNKDVLEFHKQTHSGIQVQSEKMKELWDKKYPDHSAVTGHRLLVKARELHKAKEVPFTNRHFLTSDEKEDLLRCYYMSSKLKGERLKTTQDLFHKRHPHLTNASRIDLRHHLYRFRKQNPKIYEKILTEFSTPKRVNVSWMPEETLRTSETRSTSIPTIQNNVSHGTTAHHSPLNHTQEVEEVSEPQQEELTSASTFQSHQLYTNYNTLRCQISRFRERHPKIDKRISKEVSASNTVHHSWEAGETSESKRTRSASVPISQKHNLYARSEHYPDPNENIFWSHHAFGKPSPSGYHTYPDVGTSNQNIYHIAQHDFLDQGTSQQFLRSGPSGNNSGRDSAQHHSDRRQGKSSKGKQPELDLDLHL